MTRSVDPVGLEIKAAIALLSAAITKEDTLGTSKG
jgi:hypothetical protein